jgi:hypothetical protein
MPQFVDPVQRLVRHVVDHDETNIGRLREMMRDRRLADLDLCHHLTHRHRTVGCGERVQDHQSGGIGQTLEPARIHVCRTFIDLHR